MILNVSFGIYVLLPQGWVFMLAIILIECIGLSFLLTKKWKNSKAYIAAIISNAVSGIIGIIASNILNGGWWLVVWIPWVSDNELDIDSQMESFIYFYLCAYVFTILIESIVNYLILRKDYSSTRIIRATFVINTISYLIGSLAMYSFSFN